MAWLIELWFSNLYLGTKWLAHHEHDHVSRLIIQIILEMNLGNANSSLNMSLWPDTDICRITQGSIAWWRRRREQTCVGWVWCPISSLENQDQGERNTQIWSFKEITSNLIFEVSKVYMSNYVDPPSCLSTCSAHQQTVFYSFQLIHSKLTRHHMATQLAMCRLLKDGPMLIGPVPKKTRIISVPSPEKD